MRFRARAVVAGMAMLLAYGCADSAQLPAVPQPGQRTASRGYTVLVQETLERETAFVVTVVSGTKTDRAVLLAIAKELHASRGEHHKSAVIFQAPGKVAGPRRPLEQQYANAFAVAIIDAETGTEDVTFGIFN